MTGSRLWQLRSDFLYEWSSILQSKGSLLESLEDWKTYAEAREKRWIDRLTYIGDSKEELATSIADAAKLSAPWKLVLKNAATQGRLERMLSCLADECERRANLSKRTSSTVYSSIGVLLLAWMGTLIMITSTVPAIDDSFNMLHQEPTWWLHGFRLLYDSRWLWSLCLPWFAILGWVLCQWKREKSEDLLQLSKLVTEEEQGWCSADGGENGADRDQHIEGQIQQMRSDSPARDSLLLSSFAREREVSNEEWRIKKLGIRLTLLATILVVTVYLAIGILPLIWLVRTQLGHPL